MFLLKLALCSALLFVTCSSKKHFKVVKNENTVVIALNGTTTGKNTMCYFPYVYENKLHYSCSSKNSQFSWCGTTFDYDNDQQWGYCGLRSLINDAGVVSNTKCYTYRRYNDTISYHASYFYELKNPEDCRLECNQRAGCKGFNFDRVRSACFLGLTDAFDAVWEGVGVDHYTRSDCVVVTPRPVTKKPTCVDSFHEVPNTFTSGGQEQVGLNTVDKCKEVCLSFSDKDLPTYCLGFDFNRLNNRCYIHTKPDRYKLHSAGADIDRYERVQCIVETMCFLTFAKYARRHSYDGIGSAVATPTECGEVCIENTPTCYAYDFSTLDKLVFNCYLHTNLTYTDSAHRQDNVDNVDQYVRINAPCPTPTTPPTQAPTTRPTGTTRPTTPPTTTPCVDTFSEVKDVHSPRGHVIGSFDKPEGCMKACLDISDCEAVDYDLTNKKCFYYTQSAGRQVDKAIGVNQYTRIRCSDRRTTVFATDMTVCEVSFTVTRNVHGPGIASVPNHNNVPECKAACISAGEDTCGAFDFNHEMKSCWFIPKKYVTVNGPMENIDHYVRQAGCEQITTPKACEAVFTKYPHKHWWGATRSKADDTVAKCKYTCAHSDCIAIDFNNEMNECYLYDSSSDYSVRVLKPLQSVDSYKLEKRCYDSVVAVKACEVGFEKRSSTHSKLGAAVPEARTAAECRAYCLSEPTCLAVDFNALASPKCHSHSHSDYLLLAAVQPDTVQYRIRRC